MRGKSSKSSIILLLVFIFTGVIIGSAAWSLLTPYIPKIIAGSYEVGTTTGPWSLDISFVKLTFGFILRLNFGGVIGVLLGLLIYYKS